MAEQELKISRTGSRAVATMPAEIDAMNADETRDALLSATGGDITTLIIDMSGTTFCDSAGVQAIVTAHLHAARTGAQVRLVAPAVERIFTLVGIDQLMPMHPTVGAALAAVASGPQ